MNDHSQNSAPLPRCTKAVRFKKHRTGAKNAAVKCVFRIGIALIAAVAVPAGILLFIIYLIVKAMDLLTERITKR